jgi:acyl carrier protein
VHLEATEAWVERLVREFSPQAVPAGGLHSKMSLREDLAIESLSLVSLAVELGAQVGVDVADIELELGDVKTIGDLVKVADALRTIGGATTRKGSS